jgi:hypothetical protein
MSTDFPGACNSFLAGLLHVAGLGRWIEFFSDYNEPIRLVGTPVEATVDGSK